MDWTPAPEVSLSVSSGEGAVDDADVVIIGVLAPKKDENDDDEEDKEIEPIVFSDTSAKELDDALGGALTDLAAENSKAFMNGGSAGTMTPAMRIVSDGEAKRFILLGLGTEDPEKAIESTTIMKLGAAVASACHDQKKATSCNVILPSQIESSASTLTDFSTAFYSSLYSDNRYRTGKKVEIKAEDVKSVTLFREGGAVDGAESSISTGLNLAKGVSLTKDIVNAPHNVLNSISLADTAKKIAEESGGTITCEILGKDECEKRGMGCYLGVARGSETEPQFIHLTYKPSGDVKKKVGVVGKGLLFDTGGYNIKTQMMELMKFDCGGAAAVLGAARAVGQNRPEGVEAHFVVAACENMINARAVVPSDILTASNGKTVEVLNTDAEGRLTLADALVFADKECGCESIIELSTLTGACMISLGQKICGVWTDNDDLAKSLEDVSKVTGDKSWRMPMEAEYKEQLKSKVADMTNLGGRYGGAITAALFLTEFVDKKKPFAHIDIAGPVWDDKAGATGFGAKLVSEWVKRQGE
jgi:leucyl aminopeptidase